MRTTIPPKLVIATCMPFWLVSVYKSTFCPSGVLPNDVFSVGFASTADLSHESRGTINIVATANNRIQVLMAVLRVLLRRLRGTPSGASTVPASAGQLCLRNSPFVTGRELYSVSI